MGVPLRSNDIPGFYAGRAVFITGATGFMGKILVERLLSTCPDIGRVYLLMREKRGVCPEKRMLALKQSQVFDVLRQSQPEQLDKLVLVSGDITKPQLGLSQESLAQLREVSLVFNSAATVRFHEGLKMAVDQNLRPIIRLMEISEVLPNIEGLIHVSTAYSNAERSYIEEKVYPTPLELEELFDYVDNTTNSTEEDTLRIIAPKPNTYTFTKAMAEMALVQRATRPFPVAIFRPTIVVSSLRHPFPGWVENMNGPVGVIAGAGMGLLRVSWTRGGAAADLLPVDMAIDTLIAAGWETAIDKPRNVRIYNCSTQENPCTWKQFKDAVIINLVKYPVKAALWYPHVDAVHNELMFKTWEMLLHTIPYYLVEYITRLLRFKSRVNLIKTSEKLSNLNKSLSFFCRREWRFASGNVERLRRRLSKRDRAIYNLEPETIDWNDHIANFVNGTRKYILKENHQDLEKARRRMQRLYYLHNAAKLLLLFLFFGTILKSITAMEFIFRISTYFISLLGVYLIFLHKS